MTENWQAMIELQIADKLQSLLPSIAINSATLFGHWQWQIHRFDFEGQDCVLCLEQNSSYSMLFFDLSADDYANFQQVWQYRLLAEAISIADLSELQSSELQSQLMEQCSNVWLTQRSFADGCNSLIDAQAVLEVKYLLKKLLETDECLAQTAAQEFDWGVRINRARRQHQQSPYELFKSYCHNLCKFEAMGLLLPKTLH
ncbi:hypothetical protein DBZ36_14305 [Alginatibacterium sediminis]|uniref:DUF6933 domain-containing protein n=1 Tax=Alginatibacterium sediminis TaxID=2164068 RepID=A0A420E880_9ALTE|nr:hypothetical protein [Alginatibacterium sediminis]RKF15557.1 hypothetical protein DBZ36_14305 [Alginatibacterium sediminis]